MTRSVMKLLEENRQTVAALHNTGRSSAAAQTKPNDNDVTMNDESATEIVERILEQEAWKGKRASKLDLDDFLQLLAEFNAAGIHFS
jgi:18S rRNA (adenine1779-N6/adenine1780-N6)-dimethyltransferase